MSGSAGVTTVPGASGTLYETAGGSNVLTLSATGNDTVYSGSSDTITAGGGNDTIFASGATIQVNGGAGTLEFVAGTGNYNVTGGAGADTLFGGAGYDMLTGGSATHNVLVSGTGTTTLAGGTGSAALLFGGSGQNSLYGSTGGNDTLVGGSGATGFFLTKNDVAFSGASNNTFVVSASGETVVEAGQYNVVNMDGGSATVFSGTGSDLYIVGALLNLPNGPISTLNIVGFKPTDMISVNAGSVADLSSDISHATRGAFGSSITIGATTVNLSGVDVATVHFTNSLA